jgi:hypothetical protein
MMLILAFLNLAAQYGHGPGLSDVKTKLRWSMLRASRPGHRQCPASRVPLLAPAALQAWHPCISIKCIVVQTTNCRGPGAATGVHRSRVPRPRVPRDLLPRPVPGPWRRTGRGDPPSKTCFGIPKRGPRTTPGPGDPSSSQSSRTVWGSLAKLPLLAANTGSGCKVYVKQKSGARSPRPRQTKVDRPSHRS